MSLEGRTALVTGAATGIGRATSIALAAQGAHVVLGDIDGRIADTGELIRSQGGSAEWHHVDVGDPGSVRELVAQGVKATGRLDMAFNNAGIAPKHQRLAETDDDEWDRVLRIDLSGVFYCLREELRAMESSGGGAIVNTASIAGIRSGDRLGCYTAAKHGVVGLTKAAAVDYASSGIRVNAIAPGLVATPMTEGWFADEERAVELKGRNPLGRAGLPEEIAELVVFLCSDRAAFVTGQTYVIDGGQTTR